MTKYPSLLVLFLLGVALTLVPVSAQKPKDLTIADVFDLTTGLRDKYDRPIRWIDKDHYLVFGKPTEKAKQPWFLKVHALSGKKSLLLQHNRMFAAFRDLAGFSAESARKLVWNQSAFQWGPGHGSVLMNTANDLFLYTLNENRAVRLTNSPGAEVGEDLSPNGKMVAFIANYNLHVVPTDGSGQPLALTAGGHKDLFYGRLDWVYQEELYGRGNFKGFWWSPDSTRIAFLRLDESPVKEFTLVSDTPTRPKVEIENYPKAGDPNPEVSLGVVPARGGNATYFDLSRYGTQDILISRVQWHPDGSEVYLQVQDREQRWLELLAGDPKTGKVRPVLLERTGSWVVADAQPRWVEKGGSFLWLSERDGFKHIYLYKRDGKMRSRITQGAWEVDGIVAVQEPHSIYFMTDHTNIREQHLWRVGFDGKGMAAVTQQPGTHTVLMAPDNEKLVDTFSSTTYANRCEIVSTGGQRLRTIAGSDMKKLEPYQLNPPEFVQVKTRDGFTMEAMMIKPRGYKKGQRYPVMCFTYSGPHAPQVRNRWLGQFYIYHQMLAQRGYLIWVCDNRSASGKGLKSAAACFKKMGVTETQDLEDGIGWLVEKGYAIAERIGIWGWSYGGYQTCYCLTHSKRWKLGVAVNPVTDWKFYDSIYTERYMSLPQTNPDGYQKSSVIAAAKNLHGKLLLVHSTMDDNVHMQNSLTLVNELQRHGKQFRFMVYPRVRHSIRNRKQREHLFQMMLDFVTKEL